MPSPIAVRLFDAVLGWLLSPRVRRMRRWSFVVTLPVGLLAGRELGLQLADGAALGLVVGLLEVALFAGVALVGARVLGEERRDALLDLLMHPAARRAILAELRVASTLPRTVLRRVRPIAGETFAAHRGTNDLGMAIALLPAMLAEGVTVHLLLPDSWVWPSAVLAGLHVYAMVMLVSWAVGQRTETHRIRNGVLELRSGPLYRAQVGIADLAGVEVARRREGQRTGLELGDGAPRLAAGGRTDVHLRFAVPVIVERPLGDPLAVRELAIAVDDVSGFAAAVQRARREFPIAPPRRRATAQWLLPAETVTALTA